MDTGFTITSEYELEVLSTALAQYLTNSESFLKDLSPEMESLTVVIKNRMETAKRLRLKVETALGQ